MKIMKIHYFRNLDCVQSKYNNWSEIFCHPPYRKNSANNKTKQNLFFLDIRKKMEKLKLLAFRSFNNSPKEKNM